MTYNFDRRVYCVLRLSLLTFPLLSYSQLYLWYDSTSPTVRNDISYLPGAFICSQQFSTSSIHRLWDTQTQETSRRTYEHYYGAYVGEFARWSRHSLSKQSIRNNNGKQRQRRQWDNYLRSFASRMLQVPKLSGRMPRVVENIERSRGRRKHEAAIPCQRNVS